MSIFSRVTHKTLEVVLAKGFLLTTCVLLLKFLYITTCAVSGPNILCMFGEFILFQFHDFWRKNASKIEPLRVLYWPCCVTWRD